jgi:hypothetical protein
MKKEVLCVNSPNEHISAEFQTVLHSWYPSGDFNDLINNIDQLELKHLLDIINEAYPLVLLSHINHQQIFGFFVGAFSLAELL